MTTTGVLIVSGFPVLVSDCRCPEQPDLSALRDEVKQPFIHKAIRFSYWPQDNHHFSFLLSSSIGHTSVSHCFYSTIDI